MNRLQSIPISVVDDPLRLAHQLAEGKRGGLLIGEGTENNGISGGEEETILSFFRLSLMGINEIYTL